MSAMEDLHRNLQQCSAAEYPNAIAAAALDSRFTTEIIVHHHDLLPDACARWLSADASPTTKIATLGRVLPFAPYLAEYAEHYLRGRDSEGLLGILDSLSDANASTLPEPELTEHLLGVLRLLVFDNASFAKFLQPAGLQLLLSHSAHVVRYLAIRILCLYLHAADAAFEDMVKKYVGDEPIPGQWEGKQIDYRFLSLWEEKRHEDISLELLERQKSPVEAREIASEHVSPYACKIGNVYLPRLNGAPSSEKPTLIATDTTLDNLEHIARGLLEKKPIMLTGMAGSGKTLLIRYLAHELNKADSMVTLHLNEQSDVKLLVGMYTTGSTPGSFVWQPGVLTTAVKEGRWVFIEDFDRAPNEIVSALLPLIERGELLIASRGEVIKAARGFKIIATMRSTRNMKGEEIVPKAHMLGHRLWNFIGVKMIEPSSEEFTKIIHGIYPSLSKHLPRILRAFSRISNDRSSLVSKLDQAASSRSLTSRDLLKWCNRISVLLSDPNQVTQNQLDDAFLEAFDCFAGSFQSQESRSSIMAAVAEELHIDPQRRDHILTLREIRFESNPKQNLIQIGRIPLRRHAPSRLQKSSRPFSVNNYTLRLLERIAAAVSRKEPLLLVGETGTGKTTSIQYLADQMGRKMVAFNLSQQSESGDLLGGFKPQNARSLIIPMKDEFDELFTATFSAKKNQKFIEVLGKRVAKGEWKRVCALWREALKMVEAHKEAKESQPQADHPAKKRKLEAAPRSFPAARWERFASELDVVESQLAGGSSAFAFSFQEGNIVKAMRNGDWVLLDEINLASSDTLEALSGLFESGQDGSASILLSETGKTERIVAHPDFRVFAAMNPATDVGKKDLPPGIRSRFTELYVESPDSDVKSLCHIVESYLGSNAPEIQRVAADVTNLYLEIQKLSRNNVLVDGADQKPHFSLRTLTRTLTYARDMASTCSLRRGLFEGFHMSFCTFLSKASEQTLSPIIGQHLFGKHGNASSELRKPLSYPNDGREYVREGHHWLRKGNFPTEAQPHYIITPFIQRNLSNLIRATSTRRYPVLIQGPTSSGKTSMIEYLAKRSGNKFVRINNHEHTDLQEYLGTYVSDLNGQLRFQEGILVKALREGHWIVLDELNLAPTDVLEALNRLLDDNRELLIPETQEVVRPHENFMLFATQNPAGLYGGRKILSRAFRNRFLELHFDDIPVEELTEILHRRTMIPESWCKRIVGVYNELAILRQEDRIFEQKSFATLRDLFRWALRKADTVHDLAVNGYMLLAERVRKPDERVAIKAIIERVMSRNGPRVRIDEEALYDIEKSSEMQLLQQNKPDAQVVWTRAMRRLCVLVANAIKNNEPVLLVGETGCGKTTVCQILADSLGKELFIVNAHQNTETGDLIGSQRPVRNRAAIEEALRLELIAVFEPLDPAASQKDVNALLEQFDTLERASHPISTEQKEKIMTLRTRAAALFEWADGSLVNAMKTGQFFLLDEISLADDSVLERLNSVLEPSRTLLLAEKGPTDSTVIGADGFQFMATMNPGGDYGKKELSPALRNRFTEIWVPALSDQDDILQIVQAKLVDKATQAAPSLVAFAHWFNDAYNKSAASTISIRDMLAWASFINKTIADEKLNLAEAIIHGAAMVYIDTLGANPAALLAISPDSIQQERGKCLSYLKELLGANAEDIYSSQLDVRYSEDAMSIGYFSYPVAGSSQVNASFSLNAPTTRINAMRVLRALQLAKPILLEGNPGVGKTTLVTALAESVGKPLARINLSEQTDLIDLFGSDVPVEGEQAGTFAWRDAPFLRAMKNGDWVLLDEMNLASQSVLEGLNACLDHRGEVYVAELDQTFRRHQDFRVFAAQNPHHQGGGRKGLPASFVNRFTVVYADVFTPEDLSIICSQVFPDFDKVESEKLIRFVAELETNVVKKTFGAQGSPWEFNLRDTFRLMQLLTSKDGLLPRGSPRDFLDTVFTYRFRTDADRAFVLDLFNHQVGGGSAERSFYHDLTTDTLQVGLGTLLRDRLTSNTEAQTNRWISPLPMVESLMICIQQNWPVILTGPSGSGKSQLIQQAAAVAGAKVIVFSLNADIDAIDLVGGYEQTDPTRQLNRFVGRVADFAQRQFIDEVCSASTYTSDLLYLSSLTPSSFDLARIIFILKGYKPQEDIPTEVESLLREAESLATMPRTIEGARFQWVDGILVEALQRGYWLVLDNANLCSPSVLDRLNSLLEPNGYLSINEHPAEDGTARLVRPHPASRIFLTVDPKYGELSRAMRNRGLELFLFPQPIHRDDGNFKLPVFPLESSMYRFRNLSRAMAAANTGLNKDSLAIAADHLNYNDLADVDAFERQISMGLVNRIRDNDHISADSQLTTINVNSRRTIPTQDLYHLLTNSGIGSDVSYLNKYASFLSRIPSIWRSEVLQFCKLGVTNMLRGTNFQQAQSIHPMNNEILVRQSGFHSRAIWFAEIYDIYRDIIAMEERLEQPGRAGGVAQGRKMLIRKIRSFLASLKDRIEAWAQAMLQGQLIDQTTLEQLLNIKYLWAALLDISQTRVFDEAIFGVLLSMLRDLFSSLQPSALPTRTLESTVTRDLRTFKQDTELKTGLSMERIWDVSRPITARSTAALQAILALERIAADFDASIWQLSESTEKLCQVRQMLARGGSLILKEDINADDLIKELSATIDQIKPQDIQEEASVAPYFKSEFAMLTQLAEIGASPTGETMLSEKLSLFASRPVIFRTGYTESDPYSHLERIIRFNSGEKSLKTPLSNALHLDLLHKLCGTTSVSLSQLDLFRNELGLLGRYLSQHAPLFEVGIVDHLNGHLAAIFKDLVGAHKEFLELSEHALQVSALLPKDHHVWGTVQQFLHPVHQYLLSQEGSQNSNIVEDSSKAWIQLGLAGLMLYVPDRSFDPALRPMVERDLFWLKKDYLHNHLDALVNFEKQFSNQETSLRIRTTAQNIESMGDEPSTPAVIRPERSELSHLQGEFGNLLNSIKPLLRVIEGKEDPQSVLNESLRANLSVVSQRLTDMYPYYTDITAPAVGFLAVLQTGLALANLAATPITPIEKQISFFSQYTPFAGCNGQLLPDNTEVRSSLNANQKWHALRSIRAHRSVRGMTGVWAEGDPETICRTFDWFYGEWKERLRLDQEKNAANTSLYTFKSKSPEEEEEEAELGLFPDYDTETAEGVSTVQPSPPNELAQRLATLHEEIFFGSRSSVKAIEDIMETTTSSIGRLWAEDAFHQATSMKDLLPLILLKIKNELSSIEEKGVSSKAYNFYFDANILEAKKLMNLLVKIRHKFRSIQRVWPEHMTLVDVLNIVDETYAFSHTDPLAKIITKAERLHGTIYEWQRVASKEFSATAVYDELTALLISWRRLELTTWSKLFDLEMYKCENDAKGWFFVAYELIVVATISLESSKDLDVFVKGLIQALDGYISSTTLGQYSSRLKLLRQLREHLKIVDTTSAWTVINAIDNFTSYFSRFEGAVTNSIQALRKPLEKNIDDVIKLASWKDTNIDALRQSAKSSHLKLTKAVRKYRAVLNRPVSSLLKAEIPSATQLNLAIGGASPTPMAVSPTAYERCAAGIANWNSRPPRFQNVTTTASLMWSKSQPKPDSVDAADYLDSFITQLESSMTELRKATPSTLTEENKETVKHLKTQKRKLFADVLKDLRQMGLKSNLSVDVLVQQDSIATIFATIPSTVSFQTIFAAAETELHRALHIMPQVRDIPKEHSPDLTSAEVSRSVNFIESLLNLSLRQRRSLMNSAESLQKLDGLLRQIVNIWAPDQYAIDVSSDSTSLQSLGNGIAWLSPIMTVAANVLQTQAVLGGIDLSNVHDGLISRAKQLEELSKEYSSLPEVPQLVSTSAHKKLELQMGEALGAVKNTIIQWSAEYPVTRIVLDQVHRWITSLSSQAPVPPKNVDGNAALGLSQLSDEVFSAADLLFGCMQQVNKALESVSTSTEEPSWFTQHDRALTTALNALRMSHISAAIQSVLERTTKTRDAPCLQTIAALFATLLPLFKQYQLICQDAVNRYANVHAATTKTLAFLAKSFVTVGSQGFCTPAEKSKEQEGKDEKLEDGTGLGEGEGAEDISKDIQDDEDLTELAQEPGEKDDKDDIEDEKDAVDMAGEDMEGQMGDAEEEEEKEGEGSGDEEEQDIDEETGDVDDLGPEAVDEKLWDEGGAENDKEKEGDEAKGEANKDEQVAAQDGAKQEQEEAQQDADEEEQEMAGAEEPENVGKEEVEKTDPYLDESEKLDLPEDLGMDDKSDAGSEDNDMGDLSDVEEPAGEEDSKEEAEQGGEEEEMKTEDDPTALDNLEEQPPDEEEGEEAPGTAEEALDEPMEEDSEQKEEQEDENEEVQGVGDSANEHNAQDPSTESGAGIDANETTDDQQGESQSAAKREQGAEGESADAEEKNAAGDGEQQAQATNSADRGENEESPESQAFKKLGDTLEKWYKQHRQIQNSSEQNEPEKRVDKDVDMADADFEHLPDENTEADAQAIGTASMEEARAIDESTALPSNEEQEPEQKEEHDQYAMDVDEERPEPAENAPQPNEKETAQDRTEGEGRPNAFVGDSNRQQTNDEDFEMADDFDEESESELSEVEAQLSTTHLEDTSARPESEAHSLWVHHESSTRTLAQALTEHLRLILEPTSATKLRGDFRTGKRLNLKRIIPYIASGYKRDKIWLRRSLPSKRAYQIMIALDDSQSMAESGSADLAFETVALVARSLTMLESGELCVVGFGHDVRVAHPFDKPFTSDAGVDVFRQFGFKQDRTDVRKMVDKTIGIFQDARLRATGAGAELWQLQIIISDGICDSHADIQRLVRKAQEQRIMVLFVIVDAGMNEKKETGGVAPKANDKKQSILDLQSVDITEEGKVVRWRYMDRFPFRWYLVVRDVRDLPSVLSTALRQWFAEVVESG